jgi:uncharacterized membrane protein YjjB (DUF3815 family)
MKDMMIQLITATLSTLGFSILFYAHPKRLPLTTLGGFLASAVYLSAAYFLSGELIPNLLAALVGAGYSDVTARRTKVPVPVYLIPCLIPLVPGSALYETMTRMVSGEYGEAVTWGLYALRVAIGIASGILAASVLGILVRPRAKSK